MSQIGDKIPVLIPRGGLENINKDQKNEIENNFIEVGRTPSTKKGTLEIPGLHISNILLSKIYGTTNSDIILVDEGNNKTRNYLDSKAKQEGYESLGDALKIGDVWYDYGILAEFSDLESAREYEQKFYSSSIGESEDNMQALSNEVFGSAIDVNYYLSSIRLEILLFEVIIAVISLIVSTATLANLINDETGKIALYEALGIRKTNLIAIYLLYLLLLSIFSIVVISVLSLIICFFVQAIDGPLLAEKMMDFYYLNIKPDVSLIKISSRALLLLASVVISPFISIILSAKSFSKKKIARKMDKADA